MEFVLCGVNQEPGCGGINPDIGITSSVGSLTGIVLMHDANNNGQDISAVQGAGKTYWPGAEKRGGVCLCRVNWGVVTGSKECSPYLVFVVKFFMKGVDSFDKVVARCGFSDSQEDIWVIL